MKSNSRILKAVHDTAKDLSELGFIDKRSMNRYEALCLQPVPVYSPEQIRKIRDRYHISQAVMASILNTSLSTVRQWEIGQKQPGGPSLKLLHLLNRDGIVTLL